MILVNSASGVGFSVKCFLNSLLPSPPTPKFEFSDARRPMRWMDGRWTHTAYRHTRRDAGAAKGGARRHVPGDLPGSAHRLAGGTACGGLRLQRPRVADAATDVPLHLLAPHERVGQVRVVPRVGLVRVAGEPPPHGVVADSWTVNPLSPAGTDVTATFRTTRRSWKALAMKPAL